MVLFTEPNYLVFHRSRVRIVVTTTSISLMATKHSRAVQEDVVLHPAGRPAAGAAHGGREHGAGRRPQAAHLAGRLREGGDCTYHQQSFDITQRQYAWRPISIMKIKK